MSLFPFSRRSGLMRAMERGHVTEFYEHSGAKEYIGSVAVWTLHKLDIAATATRLALPVIFDPEMPGQGHYTSRLSYGNDSTRPSIELSPHYSDDEIRQTFGHEVGHHFLVEEIQMDFAGSEHSDISEVFCEVFGTEMAEPGGYPLTETERRAKELYGIPDDYHAYLSGLHGWGVT